MAIGQGAQTLNPNRLILNKRNHRKTGGMGMGHQVDLHQFINRPLTQ